MMRCPLRGAVLIVYDYVLSSSRCQCHLVCKSTLAYLTPGRKTERLQPTRGLQRGVALLILYRLQTTLSHPRRRVGDAKIIPAAPGWAPASCHSPSAASTPVRPMGPHQQLAAHLDHLHRPVGAPRVGRTKGPTFWWDLGRACPLTLVAPGPLSPVAVG